MMVCYYTVYSVPEDRTHIFKETTSGDDDLDITVEFVNWYQGEPNAEDTAFYSEGKC